MIKVNQLRVVAFAKFQGLFASLFGFVVGLFYALAGLVVDILVSSGVISTTSYSTHGLSGGTILAFAAIVALPLIGAFFGVVSGLIQALLYNIYAARFGGIYIGFWR